MKHIEELIRLIKESDNYREKTQLAEVLLQGLRRRRFPFFGWGKLMGFVVETARALPAEIERDISFEERDGILHFADCLLGLMMMAHERKYRFSPEDLAVVQTLSGCLRTYAAFETIVYEAFQCDTLPGTVAKEIVGVVSSVPDEFYKGKFYSELLHNQHQMKKLTPEAKEYFSSYTEKEISRYLAKKDDLTENEAENLELAVDICGHFYTDGLDALLRQALTDAPKNVIRFYALNTLLLHGYRAEKELVEELAQDIEFSAMVYEVLERNGQGELFPAALSSAEQLAKSSFVHWLTYPTELGRVPDEIETIGSVDVRGMEYFVFRFRSDSDTLSENLHGQWLVGWSGKEGNSFSNFDMLKDFDKGSAEKTLACIKKKILK